ncbi:MAG: sulfide/dihydroorotate dehydrogenase-like FAD/NAD-binding protein [Angelakisella sp.]
MFLIKKKRVLNPSVTLMVLDAPKIAEKAKAGQFVMLRVDEQGERIPLTIADIEPQTGELTIIFQVAGNTTRLLNSYEAGQRIMDITGPLGNPTDYGNAKRICVIGGGVGCAIAYPHAKTLHRAGADVTVIAGFRSKDLVILEEEMKAVSSRAIITTDDGSNGEKGFVTDKLRGLCQGGEKFDLVIAIGPLPMMKFVSKLTEELGIPTIVSLNPIMIDGTGMCGGCRVTVGGKIKFACVDGPDFDGHQVDYDELMKRNNGFRREEQAHTCRLGGHSHE